MKGTATKKNCVNRGLVSHLTTDDDDEMVSHLGGLSSRVSQYTKKNDEEEIVV